MGVPAFLRRAASPDYEVRKIAVAGLAYSDAPPEQVMPALLTALNDQLGIVRLYAAHGLGRLGTNAQQAVPTLVAWLGDPDAFYRVAATNALKAIDPEAAAKAGVK